MSEEVKPEEGQVHPASGVMLDAADIIDWLDDEQDKLADLTPKTSFQAIEVNAQLYTLEVVKNFLLQCTAQVHRQHHEQAFTLPGEQKP